MNVFAISSKPAASLASKDSVPVAETVQDTDFSLSVPTSTSASPAHLETDTVMSLSRPTPLIRNTDFWL